MLRADALAKRVLGDQRFELTDHVAVMAEREVGLDPPLERDEAELLETRALVSRERFRELGERGPTPERERLAEQFSRLPGIALRERMASVGESALEPGQVELVVAHLERVARTPGVQPWFGKRLAQVRDVDLHHLLSRVRNVLAPEGVDDPLAGERAVCVEKQNREERPLLACRDLQRHMTIEHLQRAEQAKVHLERRSTLPPRRGEVARADRGAWPSIRRGRLRLPRNRSSPRCSLVPVAAGAAAPEMRSRAMCSCHFRSCGEDGLIARRPRSR